MSSVYIKYSGNKELKENSSRQVMITVLKMADCVPQGFHAGFVSKRIVVL